MRSKSWWNVFWSEGNNYGDPNKALLEFASTFFKPNMSAVDIASGNGRYAIELANIGYVVDAIELSDSGVKTILNFSKKEDVKLNAIQGDFIELCKEKRFYNLVFCSGLLEEIDQKYHENAINGFMRWTKPRGMNIIKYCLEIKGRGNLVKKNFVANFYEKAGWKILLFKEKPTLQKSKARIDFKSDYDSEIRTGTLIALKPG